jgi:very-short-patch-repair endonuclease
LRGEGQGEGRNAATLAVNPDGDTHGNDERQALDAKRTEYIEKIGYRVVLFWNFEVLTETDDIAAAIARALGLSDDLPAPAPLPDPLP